MKTRTGFVSNSSTTSFTCQVCGGVEAYPDSISDEEMGRAECERGHEFHDEHLLKVRGAKKVEGKWGDLFYPASRCPICQMQVLAQDDQVPFLLKVLGWSEDQILAEAKARCTDYAGLQAFLGKPAPEPEGVGVAEDEEDDEDDED